MSTVRELHRTAMDLAEAAVEAKILGDASAAASLLRQAMEHEIQAATAVAPRLDAEPSRSILLRSAASLALECKEYREAERLIATALVGAPPEEIADELRDLLEQVHFSRHLALREQVAGLVAERDEMKSTLRGIAQYGDSMTGTRLGTPMQERHIWQDMMKRAAKALGF